MIATLFALLGASTVASAAGTNCSGSLGSGSAAAGDPFWYESIAHLGSAPYAASGYKVFRNVMDYGAAGDGTTDDTAAIQSAIADGDRCGEGCSETTETPAVVFFPAGTYLVSSPIISYYYTTLLGDARTPPTLLASADLTNNGTGYNVVIEADPYIPGGNGANYWTNQNNFFRSVRNFVIDITAMPATTASYGVHWQVAQATSLQNLDIKMSSATGTQHVGVYMENGSGGFMSDITTDGGLAGFGLGNQQFTYRNLVSTNAVNGIQLAWNWGMSFVNATISGCTNAFNITTGGTTLDDQTAAATYILDSQISNCDTFVLTSTDQSDKLAGSLVLDNVALDTVPTAVSAAGTSVLDGGSTTIDLWAQGNTYTADGTMTYTQGPLASYTKPSGLLDSSGKVFMKSRPQYEDYSASQFISVKASGAAGDGTTDDTAALQAVINANTGCSIIYFDAGVYLITDTLTIPEGTTIVGEFFPVILVGGDSFSDASNPKVAIQVGKAGDTGTVEISNMIFSPVGGASGAIMMEWNVAGDAGAVGMWDAHFRLGGAQGTEINVANCANTTSPAVGGKCDSGYLALHVTSGASAYFENMWVWAADHDLEDPDQLQVDTYSARGILHESTAASWYIGTASEHHMLYQYNFNNASTIFLTVPQTETPYYEPATAPSDYTGAALAGDPTFPDSLTSAWSTVIANSKDILIGSAGYYSFFSSYDKSCEDSYDCQSEIVSVDSASTGIRIYNLNTVATTDMLNGILPQTDGRNGFASTATLWTSDGSSSSKTKKARRAHPRTSREVRARHL